MYRFNLKYLFLFKKKFFFYFVQEQIYKLENRVDDGVNELEKVKTELKQNEQIVAEQASTILSISNERDSLIVFIDKFKNEKVNSMSFKFHNIFYS